MSCSKRSLLFGLGLLCLAACNDNGPAVSVDGDGNPVFPSGGRERGTLEYGGAEAVASCVSEENIEGGRSYQVIFPSRVDGENVSFELHEPDEINCQRKHALILQGHGYSGSRSTGTGAFASLTGSGYVVISIDQRGSGDSGGSVRVMDPDFEGEDLVAIVDWAEQHLDFLRYRGGNVLLGSIGGSYGGMYQYLLLNKDPDRRLDAMVPEIAPHDLVYSLNPGGVVKSYWALVLAGAGDSQTGFGQDEFVRATLVEGSVSGRFPPGAIPFFAYHSMRYFCENPLGLRVGDAGDTASYLADPGYQFLPLTAGGEYTVLTPSRFGVPKVDALLWQGPRDDLFNLNEAWKNYQCLKAAGGDVRLLSYSFGHHVLSPNLGLADMGMSSQSLPLETECGPINKEVATVAWFNDKLLGLGDADEVITTGQQFCFSLDPGDAVSLAQMPVGGSEFPIALPGGLPVPVTIGDASPQVVPLRSAGEGSEVIAGIPTADIRISLGDASLDAQCQDSTDPLLQAGTCDATIFVGLGVIKLGSGVPLAPELIEEQVLPVRGVGEHQVELVGVAERIAAGDQIVLLIYGSSDAFFASTSRDPSAAAVSVSGTLRVPLQGDLPSL